ncbi:MAG: hypothetical protein UY21_C0003G0021 [Microgenomates group bacterium GW2011_GWA1_48_10]|nr:MAG: hypothetical protein UY21_C0003G0021 [Microgenomates group bacterium GW2011_GWA1_48_10]
MSIHDLNPKIVKKLKKFGIEQKFLKAKALFEENPRHPGLHTELLEPKELQIYSFRIDLKYRAQFTVSTGEARIIDVTLHYQ